MSAFFVGDECLTRCVTAMMQCAFPEAPLDDSQTATRAAAERLGRKLREMNIAALRARYGDRLDASETDPSYSFPGFSGSTPVEQWKALHCLIYQCTEGDIDTWPLYERCGAVAATMESRHRLSHNSVGYQSAAWGD